MVGRVQLPVTDKVSAHTVEWGDGLKVIRVLVARKQVVLWVWWQGVRREVRLGKQVSEIRRCD